MWCSGAMIWRDANVDLAALGDDGFVIHGVEYLERAGHAVSGAGDVNGDGRADLIVGVPTANVTESASDDGLAGVVFGKDDGEDVELADLGDAGFPIFGGVEDGKIGCAVSGAGDVNGDGLDDVVIGAGYLSNVGTVISDLSKGLRGVRQGRCSARVRRGAGLGRVRDPRGATPRRRVLRRRQRAGRATSMGTVSTMSLSPRFAVGPSRRDGRMSCSGRPTRVRSTVAELGDQGFAVDGASSWDESGYAVSRAGDVNADGRDDLVIGSPYASEGAQVSGQTHVVFGKADSEPIDLAVMDGVGFAIDGAFATARHGRAVSDAGDVDGDGRGDLLIGGRDQAFVVFGKDDDTTVDLSDLGSRGFAIVGDVSSVSDAGDINGDGHPDLLIGYPNADTPAENAGRVYVIFGVAWPGR